MPEICRFYGIVIKVYFADHSPPHFSRRGTRNTRHEFAIESLAVISGKLPPRAMGLVAEWATLHREDLSGLWETARRLEPLHRLDPLP